MNIAATQPQGEQSIGARVFWPASTSVVATERDLEWPLRGFFRALIGPILDLAWLASLVAVSGLVGYGVVWSLLQPVVARAAAQSYHVGEFIDFRKYGNAKAYMRNGWARPGEEGSVTTAPVASVVLPFELNGQAGLTFEAVGRPRFAAREGSFWVEVLANGIPIAQWSFTQDHQGSRRDLAAIPYDFAKIVSPLYITFVVGGDHLASKAGVNRSFTGYELEMLRVSPTQS